jgi:hypothetical protein
MVLSAELEHGSFAPESVASEVWGLTRGEARQRADTYQRYHIEALATEEKWKIPRRFNVKVGKFGLAKMIFKEFFQYFGHWETVFSRPCTYGVFSGPIGGFSPRPDLCVGCLRCEVQHPDFVTVTPNGELRALGDKYLTYQHIYTIDQEAMRGTVPVRGQGYRGRFGGPGFDGMFTDMSEIVRPSRDGIHGRELIGTSVDIGAKPMHLEFDTEGNITNPPTTFTIQLPFIFDAPPTTLESDAVARIYVEAAEQVDTLAILPAKSIERLGLAGPNVVPIVTCSGCSVGPGTRMVELATWNHETYAHFAAQGYAVGVRLEMTGEWLSTLLEMQSAGVTIFHLLSDHHGRSGDGRFLIETLKEAHMALVEKGVRDEVTLLGSGGIAGADNLPKGIISGLDAVGLDHVLLVAMQARLSGDMQSRDTVTVQLPKKLDEAWAVQRLVNLSCSWRDQMLEILGAMGVREVRRLRGEFGRSMMCSELEAEAFGEIEGFPGGGR